MLLFIASETAETLVNQPTGEMKLSFFELAVKGGIIMIPILILSIIAVYIFFERYFAIKNASQEDPLFMERIKDYIHAGQLEYALTLCRQTDNTISRMIEKGISRIGRPLGDIQTTIENVANLEVARLEKGLPTLATVAGAAPMIGFLGTVIGMIQAFYDMANAGSNIDVQLLSSGIYTAMVTTVAGLTVGIIAYFAYNILVARVERVVYQLEARATEFMDLLNEPVN
ncbi:MAG TPA: MotA/TolQ/ExbB proton channel family protein [Salinivirgaceae bacterium]|nr:MotA/TolQ/ExbB proton channel family protein [Salinivirgaceae bacterium]